MKARKIVTKEVLIINANASINEELKNFLTSKRFKLDLWEPVYDDTLSEEDTYDDFCGLLRRTDAEFAIIDPLAMGKEWDEYWDTLKETGNSNKIKIFRLDRYSVDELIETLKCWYDLE